MAIRIVAPEGASEPAKGITNRAGFSVAQLNQALETIAGHMETLHQLIMISNDEACEQGFTRQVCGAAADALALSIGAMADVAVGEGVVGSYAHWVFGPNFADLGKEASHG